MSIVKAGANRGLAECQRLFKNEIWNCSVEDMRSHEGQLPIFIQRTLPSGECYFAAAQFEHAQNIGWQSRVISAVNQFQNNSRHFSRSEFICNERFQ